MRGLHCRGRNVFFFKVQMIQHASAMHSKSNRRRLCLSLGTDVALLDSNLLVDLVGSRLCLVAGVSDSAYKKRMEG